MKQALATVTGNQPIATVSYLSLGRLVVGSHLIWLKNCSQIVSEARPGQFVMVRCERDCMLPRPLSIHQVKEDSIALLFSVWKDGKGTGWLSQCKPGDRIDILGPLGNGFTIQPASHNLLLVAGGIGIAPLYFLTQEALKRERSVTLLLGTKKADLLRQLLIKNPLPPEVKLVSVTEDGGMGKRGVVTDLLPDLADRADQIFTCGPMAMYKDMNRKKQELGLEGKSVQVSLEVRMGCGFGVCYGCTLKTKGGLKQVCKDGPIFDLEDILWDELALE